MSDLSVHALSAGELAYLRTRPQRTRLRMAVHLNPLVYVLRVDGAPASGDRVYEVDYDRDGLGAGVPADFANCIADLTVLVGTTIGGSNRGIVRLRGFIGGSDETSGTMEIGETSEVAWGDNLLLTIVDEFNLWPRHIYVDPVTEIVYMDRDVVYTDQHQYPDPVPVLGPDAALEYDGELGGANTIEVDFDASDSWALDGGALTYAWTATGASATVNMATATPTVTYDAPETYRVDCIVSRDYGGGNVSTFTGHRYVYVFDDTNLPILKFELLSCAGDFSAGGWTCRVKLWDEATLTEVYDRCKVTIFASDVYGSTSTSVGPIYSATHGLLRANTIFSGWIAGESITFDNEDGSVEFEIQGPHYWFNKMTSFPHGIQDYAGPPDAWFLFEDLTVDKGLWAFLHWRSTATRMMDAYLTGDAREIKETRNDLGTLWSQMVRSAEDTILASPCCDRYGRLFIEIHANLIPTGDRGAIPTVMQILRQDWREEISIARRIVNVTGMIDVSGTGYAAGTATPYFSLAFGHIFGHYGDVSKRDRLALFTDQDDNNELAGLLLGMINNEYPNVDHRMSSNNRTFDICPQQYITQAIAVTDTERGIEWSPARNLLPRRVAFRYNKDEGVLMSDVTSEAETEDVSAITGDPPVDVPDPEPPDDPDPPIPPPEESIVDWEGPIKACVAWTSTQIGYTADLLEHHTLSAATVGTAGVALHDTTVDFISLGVAVGDLVENLTSGAYEHTTVTAIVSATELTLALGINLVNTNEYQVSGTQWADADDGTPSGTFIQFVYVQTGAATVGGWFLTTAGAYWAANVLTPSPTWTLMLSLADMRTEVGDADADFKGMHGWAQDTGFLIIILNDTTKVGVTIKGAIYTNDTGASWTASIFAMPGADNRPDANYFNIEVEEVSGNIYTIKGAFSGTIAHKPMIYLSGDGGANFTKTSTDGNRIGDWEWSDRRVDIYVPYNTPATIYVMFFDLIGVLRNPVKSTDTGATVATVAAPAGYTGLQEVKGGVNGWWDDSNDVIALFLHGANHYTLHRSGDGGGTWSLIGDALALFSWPGGVYSHAPIAIPEMWKPNKETMVWTSFHNKAGWARIRYTDDEGGASQNHWSNMTGNWVAAIGPWAGASGTSGNNGNCGCIPLPRVGTNE